MVVVMKRRKQTATPTYSLIDEMTASPTEPLPEATRRHQLTRMWAGLASIEKAAAPTPEDWRVCSDAVNLMETLVDMYIVEDNSGLLQDAIEALALSGRRHLKGGASIRLDAQGIQAVRAVLEDYAAVIEQVSARTMIHCHRRTERQIREILMGRKRPHDIEIINL
jgi:uncharacterized protein YyaL (SSP411 family)